MQLRSQRSVIGELPQHVAAPNPDIYWSDNYVVVDFETTTEHKGSPLVDSNKLVLASWYRSTDQKIFSNFAGEYEHSRLLEDIERADFIVAHNAKFELGWLRRCGLDLRKSVTYDTMLAEHVLGGNKYHMNQLGLDMVCERRGLKRKEDLVSRMI